MKLLILSLLIAGLPILALAQLGLKAGLNFTNVSSVSSVNNQSSWTGVIGYPAEEEETE